MVTDLWWHGLYPLFLSFSHSWRTLRSCCLLNQTSGEGCGIGGDTESLSHRFSDSHFPPSPSGVRAVAPGVASLCLSVPPLLLSVMRPTWFFTVTARTLTSRSAPSPPRMHAETKKDHRNTCAHWPFPFARKAT